MKYIFYDQEEPVVNTFTLGAICHAELVSAPHLQIKIIDLLTGYRNKFGMTSSLIHPLPLREAGRGFTLQT